MESTLLFITASVNSLLSLFVLFGKRDKTNVIYSLFVLFASFWSIGLGFFILETDLLHAQLIANFYYISAAGIPLFFLYFSYLFPNKDFSVSKKRLSLFALPIVSLLLVFIFNKNFLIEKVTSVDWGKDVVIDINHYILYTFYFVSYTLLSYYNLVRSYISKTESEEKKQLRFIIIGTTIGFIFGMVFDLFLPLIGNYRYIFIGPLFSFSMVLAIAYSITKHHLFDTKVITTEILVFISWIAILLRTILSESLKDQLINGGFFIVAIILGIFLILSIIKEVQLREKVEKLAKDLEAANEHLKELDQLKSEFLSLATHQIRAPLTAVKGYASLVLEGDYGPISDSVHKAVQIIFNSCQNLVVIVNEFLDISRIEQGRMKYEITQFSLDELIEEVITELRPNIEKARLSVSFDHTSHHVRAAADQGKVKQIIGNLIDNAIKYTPEGGITVTVGTHEGKSRLCVSDTGIGIRSEDIPKLFGKFVRAKDANKTNVIGTGLGLYVAKQMIEAQKGRIWVESDGVGKGSRFYIELPAA